MNAQALKNTIDEYCEASGQRVNVSKSSLYCGDDVESTASGLVAGVFDMTLVRDPGTYLGLPSLGEDPNAMPSGF